MTKHDFKTIEAKFSTSEFPNALHQIAALSQDQNMALSVSFQNEETVLIDLLNKAGAKTRYFTLDTGRLPQQSYDLWQELESFYGIKIHGFFPEQEDLIHLTETNGINGFYESIEKRIECCKIRKVLPLQSALKRADAWITGLRKGQSATRWDTPIAEWDDLHNIPKFNLLADWSYTQVWDYIHQKKLPYNKLYDQGYTSIGCASCTRAIKDSEDFRAGRWWWEESDKKECGLHLKPHQGE